jgi:hypothetical protein
MRRVNWNRRRTIDSAISEPVGAAFASRFGPVFEGKPKMAQPSEAAYLRQRALSSYTAALEATDICARSVHARLATAYDDRARAADAAATIQLPA